VKIAKEDFLIQSELHIDISIEIPDDCDDDKSTREFMELLKKEPVDPGAGVEFLAGGYGRFRVIIKAEDERVINTVKTLLLRKKKEILSSAEKGWLIKEALADAGAPAEIGETPGGGNETDSPS
jgi:hypothetical protein